MNLARRGEFLKPWGISSAVRMFGKVHAGIQFELCLPSCSPADKVRLTILRSADVSFVRLVPSEVDAGRSALSRGGTHCGLPPTLCVNSHEPKINVCQAPFQFNTQASNEANEDMTCLPRPLWRMRKMAARKHGRHGSTAATIIPTHQWWSASSWPPLAALQFCLPSCLLCNYIPLVGRAPAALIYLSTVPNPQQALKNWVTEWLAG